MLLSELVTPTDRDGILTESNRFSREKTRTSEKVCSIGDSCSSGFANLLDLRQHIEALGKRSINHSSCLIFDQVLGGSKYDMPSEGRKKRKRRRSKRKEEKMCVHTY